MRCSADPPPRGRALGFGAKGKTLSWDIWLTVREQGNPSLSRLDPLLNSTQHYVRRDLICLQFVLQDIFIPVVISTK